MPCSSGTQVSAICDSIEETVQKEVRKNHLILKDSIIVSGYFLIMVML